MKCGFKTKKVLTAIKETDHTITYEFIHKKLAFKFFQTNFRLRENSMSRKDPSTDAADAESSAVVSTARLTDAS